MGITEDERFQDSENLEHLIQEYGYKANKSVAEHVNKKSILHGMGSTLTMCVINDNKLICLHIGDSRLYIYRDNQLKQITVDHTVQQRIINESKESGVNFENMQLLFNNKNILTRVIDGRNDIVFDTITETLYEGDILLLCTDGLYSMLSDEEISKELANLDDLKTTADILVDKSLKNGGVDNITFNLCKITNKEEEINNNDYTYRVVGSLDLYNKDNHE